MTSVQNGAIIIVTDTYSEHNTKGNQMLIQCKNPKCENTFVEKGIKAFCSDKCRRCVRGYNYRKAREIALFRDNYECVSCFQPSRITHHIEPLYRGGASADVSNLETRCFSCHVEVHIQLRREDEAKETRETRHTESEAIYHAA